MACLAGLQDVPLRALLAVLPSVPGSSLNSTPGFMLQPGPCCGPTRCLCPCKEVLHVPGSISSYRVQFVFFAFETELKLHNTPFVT